MGFGMQKWIYTQKPKKGFSKEKKIYGDDLSKLPKGEQLLENKSLTESEREKLLVEILEGNRNDRNRKIRVLVISLILGVSICYFLALVVKYFLTSI
jgi:hypothetical protein